MNNAQSITWQSFKTELLNFQDLILQFQYAEGKLVDPSYHITEIKQAPITSVDCGGVMNAWTEIIVQLWEPEQTEAGRSMEVHKALSIIDIVENKLALNPNGIVKIEFGNSQFDARQMFPGELINDGVNLIVNLVPNFTECKAINRGGSCGTTATGEDCCAPAAAPKVKLKMINLVGAANICEPGSGCC